MANCALCGSPFGLEYCSMCKSFFCQRCKKNYPGRVEAMMKQKIAELRNKTGNVVSDVLNFLGFH